MNLYLRLLFIYFRAKRSSVITLDNLSNQLNLTVLPNDLDISFHVNNGRYLTLCDLSRFDLFVRSGLLAVMKQKKWVPLISYHDMNFKASLKLFQRFTLDMEIRDYDEKYFYSDHVFRVGNKIIAKGRSESVIRGREGVISPQQVVEAVKEYQSSLSR